MTRRFIRYFTAIAALAMPALAQDAKQPPIRPLAKAHATSVELLGAVSQVRALPDGHVLVNDNLGRKVAMYDKSLANPVVVADTTSATRYATTSRAPIVHRSAPAPSSTALRPTSAASSLSRRASSSAITPDASAPSSIIRSCDRPRP